jgi:hypothetical protein
MKLLSVNLSCQIMQNVLFYLVRLIHFSAQTISHMARNYITFIWSFFCGRRLKLIRLVPDLSRIFLAHSIVVI